MTATRHPKPPPETEKAFSSWFLDLAQTLGWRCYHSRGAVALRRDGTVRYLTPLSGDAGYPDWTLARRNRLLFVELKTDRGRTTPEQDAWLAALHLAGAEVWVWRPRDRSLIEEALA